MVWVAWFWRQDTFQVGRQEGFPVLAANNPFSLSGGSGIAYDHLRPIKYKRLRTLPNCRVCIRRHIRGHVIAIRPDAELHIIHEQVREMKVVEVPRTGGIASLGDGDTLVCWVNHAAGRGELADDPPVRESIIDHDRIASRTSFADTAKVRPQ